MPSPLHRSKTFTNLSPSLSLSDLMAKGSGLSFDSDPSRFFLLKPTVLNSFPEDNHDWKLINSHMDMDATPTTTSSSPPPTTIQFPVNLTCSHPRLPDHHTVIGEMDFFADKDTTLARDSNHSPTDTNHSISHNTDLDFNVNVRTTTPAIFFLFFPFRFLFLGFLNLVYWNKKWFLVFVDWSESAHH